MIEYLLSVIDYTYILYFFHMLRNEQIKKIKFIFAVLMVSVVQFASELVEMPRIYASIQDDIIVVIFLILYAKSSKIRTVLDALIIKILFNFSLSFCVTIANLISVDIHLSLQPGMYRYVFSFILKCFIILLMYIEIRQIKKSEMLMNRNNSMAIIGCLLISNFFSAIIMQLSENNKEFLITMIMLNIIIFLFLVFVMNFGMITKKNYDMEIFKEIVSMTEKNINEIVIQQREIQKIIHDTKNQMLEIDMMVEKNQLEEIRPFIKRWQENFYSSYHTPVCLNVYIDNILCNKMEEYPDINFDLKINVPEQISMNTTDLISLLTIVIDHSCETLRKNKSSQYYLEITCNENEFEIFESYQPCQINTIKDSFKENYLTNIVKKYHGDRVIENKGKYKQSILLFI